MSGLYVWEIVDTFVDPDEVHEFSYAFFGGSVVEDIAADWVKPRWADDEYPDNYDLALRQKGTDVWIPCNVVAEAAVHFSAHVPIKADWCTDDD